MSAVLTAPANDAQLWRKLIAPDEATLPPEAARYFLTLEFAADDRARIHELAVLNQEGRLSENDEMALAAYRRVGIQLDILRAKARLSLQAADRGRP